MGVTDALPEIDLEKVKRFCDAQWPAEEFADKVRLEVTTRGKNVSIHECRAPFESTSVEWTKAPIAQLRYDGEGLWTLYVADRNDKWSIYFHLDPKQPIDVIINELDEDPSCFFWG